MTQISHSLSEKNQTITTHDRRGLCSEFIEKNKLKCLSHFSINTVQNSITRCRQKQWGIYQDSYETLLTNLSGVQQKQEYSYITASEFVRNYLHVDGFSDFLQVQNTNQAIITCIDEGTQFGDIEFQLDLDDNLVPTTISTQSEAYILDIAGSGAYNYSCPQFTSDLTLEEAISLEQERLDDLGGRIYQWCKHRSVTELVVTFHKGCGAVNKRCNSFPGLLKNSDFEMLESKKCALKLARAIEYHNVEDPSFCISVTTGLINDTQICKLRPMNMHNALGSICILDSQCSGPKMDILTGVNFFNVLCLSDFLYGKLDGENSIDVIDHAVRNLALTIEIAHSHHGWNAQFFTEHKPYTLFFMCRDEYQEFEAQTIISHLKHLYPDHHLSFTVIQTHL